MNHIFDELWSNLGCSLSGLVNGLRHRTPFFVLGFSLSLVSVMLFNIAAFA